MLITISAATVRKAVEALGENSHLLGAAGHQAQRGRTKRNIEVNIAELDVDQLTTMRDVLKAQEEEITPQVSKLINILADPANRACNDIETFPKAFSAYLAANGNPQLFEMDSELRGVAYLPVSVEVIHHERTYSSYDRKSVQVRLAYNTRGETHTRVLSYSVADMRRTIPQLLRQSNLMVPDASHLEMQEKIMKRYNLYLQRHGEQFLVKGNGRKITRNSWWDSSSLNMAPDGEPTKAVIDFDTAGRDTSRNTIWSDIYGGSSRVPTHPVLPVFSLAHHQMAWVNVGNMKPYEYEKNISEKLVLPKSHMRLIGALVSNLDVMREENKAEDKSRTIKAKASSSIVLAKGPAGTGKTLTAEVYSEIKERPLYEVQSGQIGTDPETIEGNLNDILARSIRLNMPLLINEADVFIQARGRDMMQNAVVSVFLRLLEYHTGLVFLTTNRSEDIDDAILSRCIAEIQYGIPKPAERQRLWRVLLKEFGKELSAAELRKAVYTFPKVVGRDIQNLIRLTSRVCESTESTFSLESLRENAVFKSIEVESEAAVDKALADAKAARDAKGK